jgi:hypothetical protein
MISIAHKHPFWMPVAFIIATHLVVGCDSGPEPRVVQNPPQMQVVPPPMPPPPKPGDMIAEGVKLVSIGDGSARYSITVNGLWFDTDLEGEVPPSGKTLDEARSQIQASDFKPLAHDSDIVPPRGGRGRGVLEIHNSQGQDAAVRLKPINTGGSDRYVFIASGRTGKISNIANGNYEVLVRTGNSWSRSQRQFAENEHCTRFEETFGFDARISGWSVTLYTVADGNATTAGVDPEEFERY